MVSAGNRQTIRLRSVFVSDVHLGLWVQRRRRFEFANPSK
jgi:hypothetical protein